MATQLRTIGDSVSLPQDPGALGAANAHALGNPIYDPQDPRYACLSAGPPAPCAPGAGTLRLWLSGTGHPTRGMRGEGSEETLSCPPLPETESEVRAIAQLFGTVPAAGHSPDYGGH